MIAGCTPMTPLPEPTIVTKEVQVPVAVPCKVILDPEPTYPATPEALKSARDIFERSQLVVSELILRRARETELIAALKACMGN